MIRNIQANIDFVGQNQHQGDVANFLVANGKMEPGMMRPFIHTDGRVYVTVFKGGDAKNPKSYQTVPMQTNATLRRDEWKTLDEAILPIAETRLGGIQDLIDKGLTYSLGNAMGTTVLEHHTMSDAMEADLTMDGVTRSQGDRVLYNSVYLPIPIIHVDYEINTRVLSASRSLGNPLDTSSAERAARKVADKLESMLFTNTTYAFGGGTIYSYINHANRNQVTITAWTGSGKTGAQMVADVLSMKQAAIDAKHYGPYALYIPTAYETEIDADYDATTPGTTIRERILKIANVDSIKVVDTLPANNVVLVQMTSDVVRLVRGMGIQNIQWQTEGNFVNKFKVITIQVPQVRADYNGASGVVHASV